MAFWIPFKGEVIATGALNLNSPTGACAKGIPSHASKLDVIFAKPWNDPMPVFTISEEASEANTAVAVKNPNRSVFQFMDLINEECIHNEARLREMGDINDIGSPRF